MIPFFTKDEIKWIKQYRTDNECGLQEAKRVLLIGRINTRIDKIEDENLKLLLRDMLELRRT